MLLPAWGQGLNALAAGQLHTRKDQVQLMVARVAVTYPKDIALIRLQARESYLLKLVHQPLFLLWLYRFVRVPGQHPWDDILKMLSINADPEVIIIDTSFVKLRQHGSGAKGALQTRHRTK